MATSLGKVREIKEGLMWPSGLAVSGSGASDRRLDMARSDGLASLEIWTTDAGGADVFTDFQEISSSAARFIRVRYDQPTANLQLQKSNTGNRWDTFATVAIAGVGVRLWVHGRVL